MKRHVLVMILGLMFLVPFTTNAFSSHEGCSGNCTDCHKLEKSDAEAVVKKVVPNGKVVDIKLSPIKSIWQIDIDADGKRGALFLDFSKKYLIAGQIVPVEAVGKPVVQKKIEFSRLPLREAIVMGPKHAAKKIAVFTDPDCPYCRKLHEEMKRLLAKRKDVDFYIFLRPLPMHKDAYKKAQTILCAKSLTLLDEALAGKTVPEPTCGNEQVEKNNALADSLEFRGTPTIVREDGTVNPGYLSADQLSVWIDGK